jgi:hypothetical protein
MTLDIADLDLLPARDGGELLIPSDIGLVRCTETCANSTCTRTGCGETYSS